MIIGLTGGIGCGKSTVGAIFSENGAGYIDSDQIVRELLDKDSEVRRLLREYFGSNIFDPEGNVDRGRISAIVFSETAELKWLEALLHPLVRKRWQEKAAENADIPWIVEVPLLFEKNLEKHFDITVCVSTSIENQLARRQAMGLTENQIMARIALQLPLREKILRADFVISNDGPIAFLRQQILLLNDKLSLS